MLLLCQWRIPWFFSLIFVLLVLTSCQSTRISRLSQDKGIIGATELYDRAQLLYEKGKYRQAKELFYSYNEKYEKSPLYKMSLYYLAHCHQLLEEKDQALALFGKVIDQFDSEDFWVKQALRRVEQINQTR